MARTGENEGEHDISLPLPGVRQSKGMTPTQAREGLQRLAHQILEDLRTGFIAQDSHRADVRRRKYEEELRMYLTVMEGKPA